MNYEITLPALIEKAGKIIGTDNSLHTIACIDIALDHAMSLRDEIYQLRQKFTAIELKHSCLGVCHIFGSEINFDKHVPESEIVKVCQDIWDNPSKYSDYKNDSAEVYYYFLKYLWVKYPDGKEIRLAEIANRRT